MPGTLVRRPRGEEPEAGSRRAFAPLLKVTAWAAGLLVALMFGMLSAYLVASAVWVGSRAVGRLRTARGEERA